MSDLVSLASRIGRLDLSPQFENYSKVILNVSDETYYEVGDETGRTLEITNPFGTLQMAQDILNKLKGYQYQPYKAEGAMLDPAAEIGDGANMRGTYGGIYTRSRRFGRLMRADISAPYDEEIDHEYKYESPQERKFTRQINDVRASLIIANDRISAKVERSGGDSSSFGWEMDDASHTWFANGNEVMRVSASGLKVKGEVEADSGKIGDFNIKASAIWSGISNFGGTQSRGVYVGTDGIQLGQAFKVDSSGAVTATNISANNMTLTGTLNIGGTNITAAALRSGAQSAYSNGSYWSGGAGYGYSYNNATVRNTSNYPSTFTAGLLYSKGQVAADTYVTSPEGRFTSLRVSNLYASWKSVTISGVTINYLGR